MSLLREIQDAATSADVPLVVVLRKCLTLASRLGHQGLRSWIEQELNGYENTEAVPDYRRFETAVYGSATGRFNARIEAMPISSGSVDPEDRDALFSMALVSPVRELEELAAGESILRSGWPASAIAKYSRRVFAEGWVAYSIWRNVSQPTIAGILDTIRNRVLAFALDIEAEDPGAGDAGGPGQSEIPDEKVNQIFNMHIYGGTNVVAPASQNVTQHVGAVQQGDWESLARALASIGVAESDLGALRQAIDADVDIVEQPALGPSVAVWLRDVSSRVASGTLAVTDNATAGALIAYAVLTFLGLV